MGNMDNYFESLKGVATNRAGDLCVIAGAEHIYALRGAEAFGSLGPADLLALEAGEPLPDSMLKNPRVLVLEVDPAVPASIQRVRSIRDRFPELKIIAAIAKADVGLVKTLVRQGISDVTDLPFAPRELAAQVLDICSHDLDNFEQVVLAPVVTVMRSTGGSGSTSVLTHLAAELARIDETGRGVCLVDFDLQAGEVAAFCGTAAPVSMGTLVEAGSRLDDELVNGTVVETRYGFSIIAAPEAIVPLDLLGPDQVSTILHSLRARFGYVLVDLPQSLSNWSLGIATSAASTMIITEGSIAGLRQARRRIDLLETLGLDRASIKVIANRVERRLFRTVGTEDMELALRAEVIASLGDMGVQLRAAQDQGALLSDTAGRNAYVRAIADLARVIVDGSR